MPKGRLKPRYFIVQMTFNDIVFGEIKNSTFEVEGDPILIKSDGFPTYHLVSLSVGCSRKFLR